ncbi:hypothetical protein F5X99DRAFT_226953 [Biscogniauxia marginata]|nr:hypothetical protein F5X99DRAFT_226953 [Biscogniauxia marginata]
MAEPVVALSGLSAILHLSSILVKLTKELRICAETIHSAPKEIMIFIRETTNFTGLLNYFYDVARDATENVETGLRARRARLVRRISQQCDYVSRGIEELVRRFAELSGGGSSSLQNLWARIMWLLKKPDVEGLRLSLQSAMAAVSLLTSLFMWEELRRKDGDVERTEMLREQIENGLPMARLARRALAEHQQRRGRVVESVPYTSYDGMKEGTFDIEKIVVNSLRSYVRPEGSLGGYPGRGRRLSRPQPEPIVTERASSPLKPGRPASMVDGHEKVNRRSVPASEGPSRGARSIPAEYQNQHHRVSAPPPRRRRVPRHVTETRSEGGRESIPAYQRYMLSEIGRRGDDNIMEWEEEAMSGRTGTETTTEQGSDLIGIAEAVRIKRVRTDTTVHELRREVVEIPRKQATERERAGTWPQPRRETAEVEAEGEDEIRGRPRTRDIGTPENKEWEGVEEVERGSPVEAREGVVEGATREAVESQEGGIDREVVEGGVQDKGKKREAQGVMEDTTEDTTEDGAEDAAEDGVEEVKGEAVEQGGKEVVEEGAEKRTWLGILIRKGSAEVGPSKQHWKASTQIDDSGSSWTSYKGEGSNKSVKSQGSGNMKSRESSRSGSLSPYKLTSSRRRLQRRQLPSSV